MNVIIPGLEEVKFYSNTRRWISIELEQQTDPIAVFRKKLYRGIVNWKVILPLFIQMQGRKCSFATEQTFVNQSTHRQFVFTSEHT